MKDSRKTKAQLIDELKESRYTRTILANEVVRLKISLACADEAIIKQQENIKELEQENTKLQSTITKIKTIAETAINGGYATKSSDYSEGMEAIGHYVLQKITEAEEE